MKVKNLFIMSLAAFSLVACSNDEEAVVPQEGSVVVNLTTADSKTKADPLTTEGYDAENAMNSGKVYAFLNGMAVKEVQFIHSKLEEKPIILLVTLVKSGKFGTKIYSPICIQNLKTYQNIFRK